MAGRSAKVKGSTFERECTNDLLNGGINAKRVPLSGAVNGFKGDIHMEVLGETWTAECKRRKRSFGTIYSYLGDNKAVFLRDDKTETLVVMRMEDFKRLAVLT